MAQDTILGTDISSVALLTKINNDFAECFVNIAEVVAARTSTVTAEAHASLDARLESIETSITGISAGSGTLISANDTTIGVLNGKLVAGDGVNFTENNDAGNETMTVAATFATTAEVKTGTSSVKSVQPATLTEKLRAHFLL